MSYRLKVRPEALADIEVAADWYENQESGLGSKFAQVVIESFDALLINPLIHRIRSRKQNIRWVLIA